MNDSSRHRAPRWRRDAGLTLTELMITMLLFTMLAAGVMVSLAGQQRTLAMEQRTNTTLDNARSTLNVMARQVRMALQGMGNGLVIVNDPTGRQWHGINSGSLPNCLNGAVPALHVVDGGNGASDMLALIYPEGRAWGSLSAPLNQADATVTVRTYLPPPPAVAPTDYYPLAIAANDWVLVSNLNLGMAFRAGSVPTLVGNDYTFSKAVAGGGAAYFADPIDPGAFVFKASWLAYRINPTFFGGGTEQVAEVLDLSTRTADIIDLGVLGEPAAVGIEDLQIALGIDGADGSALNGQLSLESATPSPNDDEWVYNVTGDNPPTCQQMANLLAVRITLVARSTSEIGGIRRARPAVENRIAAVPTDGFYRVMLRQVIAVRNRGI